MERVVHYRATEGAIFHASGVGATADVSEPLIPELVRHLLSYKAFTFADRGESVAKGFEEPMRVYEMSWRHV